MALLLLATMATIVMGQVPPWLEERADQRVGSLPARTCMGYGVAFVELLRREACDLWSLKPEFHGVEIFCGSQGVTKALRQKGFVAVGYDRLTIDASEDITEFAGALHALVLLLKIVPKGLLFMAPQCSTWGGIAFGHTKRQLDFFGNEDRTDVWEANLTAHILSFFVFVASLRGVFVVIEQPRSSLFFKHPALSSMMELMRPKGVILDTHLGGFGHDCDKPTKLYTTLPKDAADFLVRTSKESNGRRMQKNGKVRKSSIWELQDGKWYTGTKKIKTSQVYPKEFCEAIATAALKAIR